MIGIFKMNIINENSKTQQAIWVGIGSLSSFAMTLISAAILSRYLTKTDYGSYKQIIFVYNSLLIVFSAGIPKVFGYFIPRFSLEEGKDLVFKLSKLLFYSGLIFTIVLFFFAETIAIALNNRDLILGLKYFAAVPIFLLPTLGIEGIFSSYNRSFYIAVYNTVSRLITLIFIIVPVIFFNGSFLDAILGWNIASVLTFLMAIYFKKIPFKGLKRKSVSLKTVDIYKYSLPIVIASLAGILLKSADQFFISRYFGSEVFAEYSNGFIQIPFVSMITGATSMILMPIFSKIIYEKQDQEKLFSLWRSALIKSATLIYPITMFFIFYAEKCVTILYSELYINSAIYFRIALLLNLFNIIIFAPLLFSLGQTKFYARIHIYIALFAWIGDFIIIKYYPSTVIIACYTVTLNIVLVIISIYKAKRLLNTRFVNLIPLYQFFKLITISCFILLFLKILGWFLFDMHPLFLLVSSAAVFTFLFYWLSSYAGFDYKWIINSIISKIK